LKIVRTLLLATFLSGIVFATSFGIGLLLYLFESACKVFAITYMFSIPFAYIIHKHLDEEEK